MIISSTPFRMSFVGGGSDLPSYYRKYGGAVVSTAINKYMYVTVNSKFDESIRVSYSKTEEVHSVDEIQHGLVRETLKFLGIPGGLEITSVADIPSRGTGLGSSSSFTVGLLHALSVWKGQYISSQELAEKSSYLEIDVLKHPIGKQDQYAVAYGGLNHIQFNPDDSVFVTPIICKRETLDVLGRNIIVFYTGITRSASDLLRTQSDEVSLDQAKQDMLKEMVKLADVLRDQLQANALGSFGEILHENWVLKKRLTSEVSTTQIDQWYEKARAAGATGGKLLGAGQGGFLLFYAPESRHEAIRLALSDLRCVPFELERQGSRIIFVH